MKSDTTDKRLFGEAAEAGLSVSSGKLTFFFITVGSETPVVSSLKLIFQKEMTNCLTLEIFGRKWAEAMKPRPEAPYNPYPQILWRHFAPIFRKSVSYAFRRRTAPNQIALESNDPGASNGGSNFEIQPLGAELESFEVARLPQN